MKTANFDYDLPEELIASRPGKERDASRMMVVDRRSGAIRHAMFRNLPSLLDPGDLLVLNDTRVVPARFFSDDGRVELLRTELRGARRWKCMVKPGRRVKPGREVVVGGVAGKVVEICDDGERIIEFEREIDEEVHGRLALPHYIGREEEDEDRTRYQTVYARAPGAIAAPTAGLHFTPAMLEKLDHVFVTLHVGAGTFQPVRVEDVEEHRMHTEKYEIGAEAAERIREAERIVAVGTTAARVLENAAATTARDRIEAHSGETDIFIYPPHEFRAMDVLLTNFHLPKSTLFMLVCAFGGTELMRKAYAEAVRERYRFFSYGDCMVIV